MTKTALLFGTTGLVGSYLLQELIESNVYNEINVFVRKETVIADKKVKVHIIDYGKIDDYDNLIIGDDLFCCLGTTVKNAGSKKATRKVDFDYPVKIAEIAKVNKVKKFLIVSSLGASTESNNFYLKSKGDMEKEIAKRNFDTFFALRPSLLLGKRKEFRLAESIGKILMQAFGWLLIGNLKKYRAIHAQDVAKAMVYLANNKYENSIIQSDKIKKLAKL
ncbi:MAG: NAD(P)H-binding protein [Chlorobi bacterium]|nr:NAD(P)H-binding protein [Chlorobiota bacterium]